MDKIKKQEIIKEFAKSENDTGSPFVQIALLTERINNLTNYLKSGFNGYILAYEYIVIIKK